MYKILISRDIETTCKDEDLTEFIKHLEASGYKIASFEHVKGEIPDGNRVDPELK